MAAKTAAIGLVVAAPWVPSGAFRFASASAQSEAAAVAPEIRRQLQGERGELVAFYRSRSWRPLWLQSNRPDPAVEAVLGMVRGADRHGLDPLAYQPQDLSAALIAARSGDPAALARVEIAASRAFTAYLSDLRTPPQGARSAFTDPALPTAPPTQPLAILHAASVAPSLLRHVQGSERMNPLYERLQRALLEQRARSGRRDAGLERLIIANMDRVRGLPRDLGERFVVVDAAAMQLDLYEDGEVVDTMPVVVGRLDAPTPEMAGIIRYVRFNPYWNLPQSMVREEVAPRVLREGRGFLGAQRMQILSDWSREAKELDPADVDWDAVSSGVLPLRVRQLPGPGNILGSVKLMLPNPLGVYLHDTPQKTAFASDQRRLSAGCVRLADAGRLTRRLLGWTAGAPGPEGVNQRVDLPSPVPVYITYLTVDLRNGRLVRRLDVYGRDPALLAARAPGARSVPAAGSSPMA